MKRQQGFTIVELVAVMIVIGVLSAIAAPKFIGSASFDARGAQGTLLSALRLAQKTAIAQRTLVYVVINTGARTVCLGYTSNCSSALIDPATRANYLKTLPSTVNLTSSVSPITFNGLGQETSNQTVTVTVQNNVELGEPVRVIAIERETGYVH